MKFTIPTLSLLTISSTFAASILNKRFVTPNYITKEIDQKCLDTLSSKYTSIYMYSTCFGDTVPINNDKNAADKICKAFNSSECQKLVNTKVNELPECKDSGITEYIYNERGNLLGFNSLKAFCTKDENGQYCKFNDNQMNTEDFIKPLDKETATTICDSKTCVNAYLEYLEGAKKIEEDYAKDLFLNNPDKNGEEEMVKKHLDELKYNEVVPILKSETCAAKNTGKVSSNASSVTYTNSVLVALALLLFTLL